MEQDRRGRLRKMARNLDDLGWRAISPWLDAGLDPQGGAYGYLDRFFVPRFSSFPAGREHTPLGPSGEAWGDQSLVQQSRHLFAYSFFSERRPGDPRTSAFAHHIYRFISTCFVRHTEESRSADPKTSAESQEMAIERPLLHFVRRGRSAEALHADPRSDHAVLDPQSPYCVQLYAQSFAVFGLATYSRVFSVHPAARQARQLFELLDRHYRALGLPGYDQSVDGGWMQAVRAPKGAVLCTNTHIHVLEALTALCRCFPCDAWLESRLSELALLIAEQMTQPPGYVHKYLDGQRRLIGPPEVSYGHDLETSWLLLDALDVLGSGRGLSAHSEETVREAAEKMAFHALRTGWDPAGGVFEAGVPEGAPGGPRVSCWQKVWWAQAEALPAIFCLYRRTAAPELLDRLEKTLHFLSERSTDRIAGEFFWSVDSEGVCGPRGDHKGEIWKTPYHAVRACVLTADWIRAMV